jgi:hypothetical protein
MFARLTQTLFLVVLAIALPGGAAFSQDYQIKYQAENPEEIQSLKWEDLMSRADLDAILNAPPVSHEGYGWEEQLGESNPENDAFQKALQSFDVNPELLGKRVLLPGFIVPTAYNDERKVTEFFLVPFFGACIHVPPPPPNQIIHVSYAPGLDQYNMYDAYYVLGSLSSQVVRHELANSAYSLQAEHVELYDY